MPTNLQIDDELLVKAQKIGGFRTKKDTVNQALADFIRRHEQVSILDMFGAIDITEGFDHKALRAKR